MSRKNYLKSSGINISRMYAYKNEETEIIKYIEEHDRLTGLYNRQFIQEKLNQLDDNNRLPISIVVGDINGLRFVNNILGYSEGDRLIKSVAQCINETCPDDCIAARWSGDEFIIIIFNTAEEEIDGFFKIINQKFLAQCSKAIKPSISFGYEMKKRADQNILDVLKAAEGSMYKYKYLDSSSFRSSIIGSIKKSLFEKSHETEEHEERLKLFSVLIGKSLNLSENELHELELSAMLHDIGKIAIKDNVLNKQGKLNDEEWNEMKKHPEIGYRIALSMPELNQVANFILCHHERFDGKGYPNGIKGNEIPLMARIVSIADAYDAMTSDRPYRRAMTKKAALDEILKNSGTQFDPEIVDKFALIINKVK